MALAKHLELIGPDESVVTKLTLVRYALLGIEMTNDLGRIAGDHAVAAWE